jgi:cadmium resistance protein CadD (predicted permease)
MGAIAGTIATASGMFAGTNIDDLVVLTVLNISARGSGAPKRWEIWAGQFIGIGLMVVVSGIAALGLSFVPLEWVGLLGLVPLTLGVLMLIKTIRARGNGESGAPAIATGLMSVIGVTFANGGDNISVYTPAFLMGLGDAVLTIAVFAIGTALWCLAGFLLISHKRLVQVLERFGRWIVPAVFILLGVYILNGSGLLTKIL